MKKEEIRCNKIKVPKSCCYLSFGESKGYVSSHDDYETIRDEQMIIDFNKEGKVIGIELLSSKKARKKCQEQSKEQEE